MDDTNQSPPADPAPAPSPAPEQMPVVEDIVTSEGASVRRKAFIGTLLVALVLGAGVLLDPFNLFDIQISKDFAAEPSPDPTITAMCTSDSVPKIRITWGPIENAILNGIEKSVDGSAFVPIYFEGGDAPFSAYSFTDSDIQLGAQYRYRVISGTSAAPTTSITCS